jgi:photosystem II stability/assembly factor-like uncharacterized protein
MACYVKILFAFLMLNGTLKAQTYWSWQNPLPQGNGLADICFVDSLRGWAVGGAGTTVRTTNGGQKWLHTQAPIHELLIRTSFVSATHGWAMTYFTYKVLETTNGGITWDSISTIPSPYYLDMQFLNDSVGFVSGNNGKIMRTTDGGVSWAPTQTNYFGDLIALHFSNPVIGYAAGPGRWALKTTNGGLSWAQVATAGFNPSTRQVFSVDAQRAYLVGSHEFMGTITGCFYSTTNGGATWQEKYFSQELSDVYFSSPNTGWVSDIDGVIFQTTDGGATWTQLSGRSIRFTFAGARRAWGVTGSGLILATDDGWHTYRSQTQAVTTWTLWALSAYDSNNVVACGINSLIVGTKDGGKRWTQYSNPNQPAYLMDIIHKSSNEIWAVGEGGLLVYSTDGGATWSDSTLNTPWLSGIAFATESIGYCVSSTGDVFRTSDGGKTWFLHTTIGNTPLERVVFANPSLGWIVADNGVHRSTDGGKTWQHVYMQTGVPLDVAAIGNRVWFPRINNVVYSTDAGSTWTTRTVFPVGNIIYDIRSLAFSDENNGWVASNNGRIYRTTNGGDSWSLESDMNGNSLFGIRFVDSKRGWAVGGGGAILHFNSSTTSAPEPVASELPARIELLQNYPNPFNPVTTIEFSIPRRSTVVLKVFDLLGREVQTLISGQLEAGTFSLQWSGQQASSGIYFYRLQADGYVHTKRMLLVK